MVLGRSDVVVMNHLLANRHEPKDFHHYENADVLTLIMFRLRATNVISLQVDVARIAQDAEILRC
jgi:hypothetical protein